MITVFDKMETTTIPDSGITILNDDCIAVMKQLPDKSYDLAIVDPPYYRGPERRGAYGARVSSLNVERKEYPVTSHWVVPDKEYFKELERVAKHYIVWGCNYFDWHFASGRIVWDKCNGASSFSDCEIAATDIINSVRMFRFMWNGMQQGRNIKDGHIMQGNKSLNEKRIHPTQKPVALYGWLLQNFAKSGYRILDTHLGSGSSAVAAYEMGYEFLGVEIEPIYFKRASERLLTHSNQLRIFM